MSDYPRIRQALELFDISVGLTDEAATRILSRQLAVQSWRDEFISELRLALADANTPWRYLMFNDRYEVYEFDTDQEARNWVVAVLWHTSCPNEPAPASL